MQQYPYPWSAVGQSDAHFDEELLREVCPSHVLSGVNAKAIAMREDRDDVVFFLENGPSSYVVVHLTWSGARECDSDYPTTKFYQKLEDLFADQRGI